MFHSWMHFGCSYSILTDFVSAGAIAMTGFFMLSGYALRLVYGELNLMEKHNLTRFYLKRLLGILPLYYFSAIVYVLFIGKESIVKNLLLLPIEALGLQSTFSSLFDVSHNGGTWFISCILLAYIIYPFLQLVCIQLNLKNKFLLLLALMTIDVFAVIITHKFDTAWTYDNPFYRIVEFTCGLLIADINMRHEGKNITLFQSRYAMLISTLCLVVGISLIRHYLHYRDYMMYNIIALPCFAILLISLGKIKISVMEKSKVIGYFGKISYAFFLTQLFCWPVCTWIVNVIGYNSNGIRILISFAFCLITSILMYELIQKPIVKLIKIKK